MLAYVFWHWKRPGIGEDDYEARQRAFHAALAASPPPGFVGSASAGLAGAPWAAAGGPAYEDWYLVEDFGALGLLNEAAISAARAAPHDAAAAGAAGGTAGLYRLRLGAALPSPRWAHWFGKPEGTAYADLLAALSPVVAGAGGALWMRAMTLGPAREFCLHAGAPTPLPAGLDVLALPLRAVWPGRTAGGP